MNYKIRITAENQAIIKRIADENEMNPNEFKFNSPNPIYHIENGEFTFYPQDPKETNDYTELTTEQFVQMFDKKETELDKWLKETKDKNLSEMEIYKLLFSQKECPDNIYIDLKNKFSVNSQKELSEFLFNQWNNPTEESPKVETEWQPKRGDRVLVFDDWDEPKERIYLTYSKGERYPYRVVSVGTEDKFNKNELFESCAYQHMKPLPIEQPKEPNFKSKFEATIELIENEIKALENKRDYAAKDKLYQIASGLVSEIAQATKLLNKIKELK